MGANLIGSRTSTEFTSTEISIIYSLYRFANASGKLGEILMEDEDQSAIEMLVSLHSLLEKINANESADAFEGMIHSTIKDFLKGGH